MYICDIDIYMCILNLSPVHCPLRKINLHKFYIFKTLGNLLTKF